VRIAICILFAAVGTMLIGVGANGAGMPKGGLIRIYVVPGNGQGNGTIVVVGAIGDYGKTTKQVGGFGKALLHKGTFKVNLNAMSKALNNAKPVLYSATTCSGVFSATAPAAISNGTGAYKGISGTLILTETFAGYGPFYTTGAHKGKCNTSPNSNPTAQWGAVTGVGTVKYT
jgi:hypothetical protein